LAQDPSAETLAGATAIPKSESALLDEGESALLDEDGFHDVGHAFYGVGDTFERLNDVLPLQDLNGVVAFAEEPLNGLVLERVNAVFDQIDALQVILRPFAAAEASEQSYLLVAHAHHEISELRDLREPGAGLQHAKQ
jgi:hypothetical protein